MAIIFWKNGISGLFSDTGSWLGGVVPGPLDTADLFAPGVYTVTVPADAIVANFGAAANATLAVAGGTFRITQSVSNAGRISITSAALEASGVFTNTGAVGLDNSGASLIVDSSLMLNGSGRINLVSGSTIVADATDGGALINHGERIQGAGQIGAGDGALTFTNAAGVVNASGGTLTLSTGATIGNSGLLEASNIGTLNVQDDINNAGGYIFAINGPAQPPVVVNLNGAVSGGVLAASGSLATINVNAAVTGATLRASHGGLIVDSAATLTNDVMIGGTSGQVQLRNVTLAGDTLSGDAIFAVNLLNVTLDGTTAPTTVNGVVTIAPSSQSKIKGALVDHGVLTVGPNSESYTYLYIDKGVTLSGGGKITLNTLAGVSSYILGDGADKGALTNLGAVIDGAGQIGGGDGRLRLLNTVGTVSADSGGQTLTINTGNLVANSGVLKAAAGATLTIYDRVNNAGGLIKAEGTVNANGALSGGTLEATASGADAELNATATNANIFALGGGVVNVKGAAVSGALVQASGAGSAVELSNGVVVSGAQLATTAGGVIGVNFAVLDSTVSPVSIAAGAKVLVNDNGLIRLKGAILNSGEIDVGDATSQSYRYLSVSGPVTLNGNGKIALNFASGGYAWIEGDSSTTDKLVNNGQTLSGAGGVGYAHDGHLSFENKTGLVNANIASATMAFDTGNAILNEATLEATGGGRLTIYDSVTNASATLAALTGSQVNLNGGVSGGLVKAQGAGGVVNVRNNVDHATVSALAGGAISVYQGTLDNDVTSATGAGSSITLDYLSVVKGGSLTTLAGATLSDVSNATLDGFASAVTLGAGTKLAVTNGSYLYLDGVLFDNGEIDVGATDSATYTAVQIEGAVTLAGAGKVKLAAAANGVAWIFGDSNNVGTLTNQIAIEGAGGIGYGGYGYLSLTNDGTVNANVAGAQLTINTGNQIVNNQVLEATNGGQLNIDDKVTNATGTIEALTGGAIYNYKTIDSGIYESLGAGSALHVRADVVNATVNSVGGLIEAQTGAFVDDAISVAGAASQLILGYHAHVVGGSLSASAGAHISADTAYLDGTANPVEIKAGTTVQIVGGSWLDITGAIADKGAIVVGDAASGSGASLFVSGDATLSGGGRVTLSSSASGVAWIQGDSGNAGHLINSGDTIQGAGGIGAYGNGFLSLTNDGLVNANVSGAQLTISTGNQVVNNKTLEASNGGQLNIYDSVANAAGVVAALAGSAVYNYAGVAGGLYEAIGAGAALHIRGDVSVAAVKAVGGAIDLQNASLIDDALTAAGAAAVATLGYASRVVGGSLAATGGAQIIADGVIFDGTTAAVDIKPGTKVQIKDGSWLDLKGALIDEGVVTVGDSASPTWTELYVTGNVKLSGGGKVNLGAAANGAAWIWGDGAVSGQLTNAGDAIEGAGGIGIYGNGNLSLINASGAVNANVAGAVLALDTGNLVTNSALLEATGGGELRIYDAVANDTGVIEAASGSTVKLYNHTTTGGLLEALGAGAALRLQTNATVAGATLLAQGGGALIVDGNAKFDGLASAVTLSAGNQLQIADGAALGLMGAIVDKGEIDIGDAASTSWTYLYVSGTATLSGGGKVELAYAANGLNWLTGDSGAPGTLTNQGDRIEGAGAIGYGGDHNLTFLNTAGAVSANIASAVLNLETGNAVVNTALMQATNGGVLEIYDAVTNAGGVIRALGGGVYIDGAVTGGLLQASGAASSLTLRKNVSGATIQGLAGAALSAHDATLADDAITVSGAGSSLNLGNNLVIAGGSLTARLGATLVDSYNATLDGTASAVTLSAGSILAVQDGASLQLMGVIAGGGEIDVADGASATWTSAIVHGAVTLTGGGRLNLAASTNGYAWLAAGDPADDVLTNQGDTIFGAGGIGYSGDGHLTFNNAAGVVRASAPGFTMTLHTGNSVSNGGALEAAGGSQLTIQDSVVNTATGALNARADATLGSGQILLSNQTTTGGRLNALGGAFNIQSSTVSGAMLTASGGGSFAFNGATLVSDRLGVGDSGSFLAQGSTLDGRSAPVVIGVNVDLQVASTLTLMGGLVNQGLISAAVESRPSYIVSGAVVLGGAGVIDLGGGALQADTTIGGVLNNISETLTGDGHIGGGALKLINRAGGAIDANGRFGLTIATGAMVLNAGLMEATYNPLTEHAGSLAIDDAIYNTGTLLADRGALHLLGALTGAGTVGVANGGAATLEAASTNAVQFNGPGLLTLDDAPHMRGVINGFSVGDGIDLAQFASGHTTIAHILGTGAAGTNTDVTLIDRDPALAAPVSTTLHLLNAFDGQYGLTAASYQLSADSQATPGTLFRLAAQV